MDAVTIAANAAHARRIAVRAANRGSRAAAVPPAARVAVPPAEPSAEAVEAATLFRATYEEAPGHARKMMESTADSLAHTHPRKILQAAAWLAVMTERAAMAERLEARDPE